MIIKKISFFLLLSVLFMPTANADFLGIGGWTKRNITKPLKRKVIDPVITETKHQIAVVRKSKAYKEADKVVQDARNSKAYKAADKVLVSASRAVRNDCEKYNAATALGWRVYRFTSDQVKSGMAIKQISEVIK